MEECTGKSDLKTVLDIANSLCWSIELIHVATGVRPRLHIGREEVLEELRKANG